MYSIKSEGGGMKMAFKSGLLLSALIGAGMLMSGCAEGDKRQLQADLHQADDFGRAVREDLAAQIVDPDAPGKATPPPSDGQRANLAATRYQKDSVIKPQGASTTSGVDSGSSGGGSGGNGGGAATSGP